MILVARTDSKINALFGTERILLNFVFTLYDFFKPFQVTRTFLKTIMFYFDNNRWPSASIA